ncbi:DUF1540 domain-containing protein [Brevibacillus daliensis]|uniref:DUF1540 domain-containing protein n=1 Tax=Brevibacillus daliensis TaxID=2892995 RepID=UPI001E48F543|nr:DUF1540 domain-containing protein [Brevibacillus daliensis]
MPEVKCSVSNCTYWGQGNNCVAKAIMVEIDAHAKAKYNAEFAGEIAYDTSHQDQATTSRETCCHTFKPKV